MPEMVRTVIKEVFSLSLEKTGGDSGTCGKERAWNAADLLLAGSC
jgi:hypothetical protein